jgi:hypothetical protein
MSRAKRIFKLIAAKHPDLILCQDRLVVVPTEQILRGFLIETTSSKDMVNVWRMVMPLYQPRDGEYLDYSDHVAYTYVNRSAYQDSAEKIDSIITPHIPILRKIARAQDFLKHIQWRVHPDQHACFHFDLALTYYRAGKVDRAISIMKKMGRLIDRWYESYASDQRMVAYLKKAGKDPFESLMKRAARKMVVDPVGFATWLDKWEKNNFKKLELEPTRAAPSRSRPVSGKPTQQSGRPSQVKRDPKKPGRSIGRLVRSK